MHYCISEKSVYMIPAFGILHCLPPLLFRTGLQGCLGCIPRWVGEVGVGGGIWKQRKRLQKHFSETTIKDGASSWLQDYCLEMLSYLLISGSLPFSFFFLKTTKLLNLNERRNTKFQTDRKRMHKHMFVTY